jgi:alpha-tubulin suppressor-like RCC1 family protein
MATTRFVQIVSGAAHNCALDTTGGVWCWGRNTRGALGDGSTANRALPTRVRLPGRAADITAGTAHSCAMLADGRTLCWGDNLDGQLGDETRTARLSPVAVHFPTGRTPTAALASPRAR